MTTLSSYLSIANNLSKWQTITAKSADVVNQTQYFTKNIGSVHSAADLIKNPRLFNYAMTAFGLGNMTYATGMMKQVLQQGVAKSTALANTLNNPDILAFAKAFDFVDNGAKTTSSPSLVQKVVSAYTENTLENNQGQQNPGVQLALYFQRNAPNITNAYQILGDNSLLTVVQTALGISPMTSMEPIDTQAAQLKTAIDFSDFKNPTKLQSFISRFAAMYDYNNGGSSGTNASTSTDAVLLGAAQSASGDTDFATNSSFLLNLQNFQPA